MNKFRLGDSLQIIGMKFRFSNQKQEKKIVFNEKCKMADAYADFWNFK